MPSREQATVWKSVLQITELTYSDPGTCTIWDVTTHGGKCYVHLLANLHMFDDVPKELMTDKIRKQFDLYLKDKPGRRRKNKSTQHTNSDDEEPPKKRKTNSKQTSEATREYELKNKEGQVLFNFYVEDKQAIIYADGLRDIVIVRVQLPSDWAADNQYNFWREQQKKTAQRSKRKVAHFKDDRTFVASNVSFCRIPTLDFMPTDGAPVLVFAFPLGSYNMWTTTITSVHANTFQLQALSAPGASGGAVVTSPYGALMGIVGGAYDCDDKNTQWQCYACKLDTLTRT